MRLSADSISTYRVTPEEVCHALGVFTDYERSAVTLSVTDSGELLIVVSRHAAEREMPAPRQQGSPRRVSASYPPGLE